MGVKLASHFRTFSPVTHASVNITRIVQSANDVQMGVRFALPRHHAHLVGVTFNLLEKLAKE
jgi:hypothetical protein